MIVKRQEIPIRQKLTENESAYVVKNHERMPVKNMADHLHVPTSRVYGFLRRENLEFVKTRTSNRARDRQFAKDMFNPFAHPNWII